MNWETVKAFLNEYGYVIAIVAAALLVILLIVIIAAAARASKLKRENKKLRERAEADERKLADIARAMPLDKQGSAPAEKVEEVAEKNSENETKVEQERAVETAESPNSSEPERAAEEADAVPVKEEAASKEEEAAVEEDKYVISEENAAKPVKAERKEPTVVVKKPEPKPSEPENKYTVKYDRAKGNWIIVKAGNTRPTRRVATKAEALAIAKELADASGAALAVHKKDGKFQKQ